MTLQYKAISVSVISYHQIKWDTFELGIVRAQRALLNPSGLNQPHMGPLTIHLPIAPGASFKLSMGYLPFFPVVLHKRCSSAELLLCLVLTMDPTDPDDDLRSLGLVLCLHCHHGPLWQPLKHILSLTCGLTCGPDLGPVSLPGTWLVSWWLVSLIPYWVWMSSLGGFCSSCSSGVRWALAVVYSALVSLFFPEL